MTFEYKDNQLILEFADRSATELRAACIDWLNTQGQDGWGLVYFKDYMGESCTVFTAIFQRELR